MLNVRYGHIVGNSDFLLTVPVWFYIPYWTTQVEHKPRFYSEDSELKIILRRLRTVAVSDSPCLLRWTFHQLGVLCVGHSVADHVLKEHLEDAAGLLVDEAGDTLHATAASETADGGLGNALDVIAEHLAVALGASLAKALASLATSRHVE